MRESNPNNGTQNNCGPVVGHECAARIYLVADWPLHPRIVHHDPEGGKAGAQCHHPTREQIEPHWNPATPEKHYPEKRRLECERSKTLIAEERPLDRAGLQGELTPVRAELEGHDNPGDDAKPEGYSEYLEPKIKKSAVEWPPRPKLQTFEECQPSCEPDREGWKNDVKRHGERELQSR